MRRREACAISARPLPSGELALPEARCRLTAVVRGERCARRRRWCRAHARAVQGQLTVRGRRPGDRYRPLGAPGSRKLQDIFVDHHVPRRWRERIPVITDAQGIIWLAGFRLAERVKILPTTTHCLQFTIEWS